MRSWMRCGGCGKWRSEERLPVATDKRTAERELKNLLIVMSRHRRDLAAYVSIGDFPEVERCEQLLKAYYARIRAYCAKHDLELPHDVPPEDAA